MRRKREAPHREKIRKVRRPAAQGKALILIGMPGCGKTTLGKRLARRYGKRFIDVDDVLVAREGRSVADLAAALSYDEFVRREEAAVRSITDATAVIATGGSVIYSPRSMEHLHRLGTVIYLEKPFKETRRRAGDPRRRGIVIPPDDTYANYQTRRHGLYRANADIIYETAETTVYQSLVYLQGLLEYIDPETFTGAYPPGHRESKRRKGSGTGRTLHRPRKRRRSRLRRGGDPQIPKSPEKSAVAASSSAGETEHRKRKKRKS